MPLPCGEFYHAANNYRAKTHCKYLQQAIGQTRLAFITMKNLHIIRPQTTLPRATSAAIIALTNQIWPPASDAPPRDLDQAIERWRSQGAVHFVIVDDEDENLVLANARLFRRGISTAQGPLAVGALASVCVHPAYRGRGWGAEVVRAAFDYLPEMHLDVALFQTGVPQFYEKLGCRMVENRFHNGGDYEDAFWDEYKMIYPVDFAWPDGEIDLNGPGY